VLHAFNHFLVFDHAVHPILARYETNIAVRTNQKNEGVFIRDPVGGGAPPSASMISP
jgi:hypothetical protein